MGAREGSIEVVVRPDAVAARGPQVVPARSLVARALAPWRAAPVAAVMFASLVVLNVIDVISTRLVLDRGGTEGNPVMAPVVDTMLHAVAVKGACLALIGALILKSRRSRPMMAVIAAVNVWYAIVVCWNVVVLARLT